MFFVEVWCSVLELRFGKYEVRFGIMNIRKLQFLPVLRSSVFGKVRSFNVRFWHLEFGLLKG